jgi:large subunit ribosomal protein L21
MKIAVIKTGGKQYLVQPGKLVKVEKLEAEPNDVISLETLLVADGDNVTIGTPTVKDAVKATIVRHGRNRKVAGVKYKPKTRQHTKFGHKQHFTEIAIS